MNRRQFLRLGAAGIAGAALGPAALGARRSRQVNVIVIMSDDLGYGDLGCYGGTKIRTPNIDALAAGGLRFTDYHSNCPVCSPTRAALLTGRYQQRTTIEGVVYAKGPARETGMPLSEVTFAEILKAKGYVTGIFGKWHIGYNVEFNPIKQGFDEFRGYVSGNVDFHSHFDGVGIQDWWQGEEKVPEEGYTTDLITKHALDFLGRNKDRPFCLYVPHEAPHSPYQGRKSPPERLGGGKKGYKAGSDEIPVIYKEMVEVMDEGVGKVVDAVKRLGLERNTFIFFCSDNGATRQGSNAPLNGFKGGLLEGGHRVPAVAYWPGRIEANTTTDETVLGMDLFATIATLTGAEVPADLKLDGIDITSVLMQSKKLPRRTLFWRYNDQKAVRKGPWKLLIEGKKTSLYNLDDDLAETTNLAAEEPKLARQLKAELTAWEADVTP